MERHRSTDVTRAAWLEWRTSIPSRTPDEHGRIAAQPVPDDFDVWPPRWFKQEELGRAFEHGPSIEWTMRTVVSRNRNTVKQMGREAPYRTTYPPVYTAPPPPKKRNPKGSARRAGPISP